jgi:cytochrome P450
MPRMADAVQVRQRATAGPPPGPGRRGSLRMIGERRRDPIAMFERLRDEHGPFVRFRLGPLDMYLVTDPDLVQQVFTTYASRVRKGRILEGARVILGDGLLTAEGEHHRRQRRLIQPAFHSERLEGYARIMTRRGAETADRWGDGEVIDVFHEMSALTTGVVSEALFGAELREDEFRRVEEALVDVFRGFDLLVLPFSGLRMRLPSRTMRRFRAAKAELERIVDGVIAERRADGRDRGDLLSMLLAAQDAEDGAGMTDEEVRHEVMTLFAAGLETTANALTFAWHLLARHPESEARLRAEAGALGGDPGLGDVARLPYAERVLNEALRLYPPGWMLARRCVEELPLGDYLIPVDGLVLMPPYLMHRDPRFWPEPERFDPDRWAEGAGAPPHRFSYFPFGAGPRKCIGASFAAIEATLLLAVIARRVRLEALSDEPLELQPQITLRPRGSVPMRVRREPAG